MIFDSFLSDVFSTFVGGILLALSFFWIREKWFSFPEIEGRWFIKTDTIESDYDDFRNMILVFNAMIWREENLIKGTAEKIYEMSSTVQKEYVGKERTRSEVNGWIERKYFSRDRIYLHVVEQGHRRESTTFYTLVLEQDDRMVGTFVSMVANVKGRASCSRDLELPHSA
ncbi:MAG: hypothetical protein OYG32_10970 [Rhodospirillaceae bacterium]|nr:hypothetical protein [Rhodospirillaceae bacterium]MDE0255307.1 hypothetical protein [Rhodospirillaceae bacterium]MDE0618717.1 hypothetical protein [Rhodospirillaceae bacterium]